MKIGSFVLLFLDVILPVIMLMKVVLLVIVLLTIMVVGMVVALIFLMLIPVHLRMGLFRDAKQQSGFGWTLLFWLAWLPERVFITMMIFFCFL
jgi:hypothetical protein